MGDFDFDLPEGMSSRARDEIMNRHRMRRDHRSASGGADFHEERHKKFLDMNRRRADRLKNQVKEAGFTPEEEAEIMAKVELYHDKEFELAEFQHENKQKLRDDYGAMTKEQREKHREKEKKERFEIRDMRLDIEKRIAEKTKTDL